MDRQFADKLQTELQLFGREGKYAPPKSQDPMDKVVHEYFVCDLMASIANKRRGMAKEMVIGGAQEGLVDGLISSAIKQNNLQSATLFSTEHYVAVLRVAKPVEAIDHKKLRTELIKLGVDEVTIQKAYDNAQTTREPAKTLVVTTTHSPAGSGR
jgi:hypothetical protein